MTPEGKTKAVIDKFLRTAGIWYFKPVSLGLGRHGIPDYICCAEGLFFGIEAKAPGGKVSALQQKCMNEIREHGGDVFVVYCEDDLEQVAEWLISKLGGEK